MIRGRQKNRPLRDVKTIKKKAVTNRVTPYGEAIRIALHSVTDDGKKISFFDLFIEDEEDYRILRDEVFTYRITRYYLAGVWESADCEIGKSGEWEIVGVQKQRLPVTISFIGIVVDSKNIILN